MNEEKEQYLKRVDEILSGVNFPLLSRSCNSSDLTYAQEVLERLHQAFVDTFGTDCIAVTQEAIYDLPVVIRGRDTGRIALGLALVDFTPAPRVWGMEFFTEQGRLQYCNLDLPPAQRQMLREQFIPCDYWYTPEIPQDTQTSFDNLPAKVQSLLSVCVGAQPQFEMTQTF